jgi:putative transposase
MKKRHSAEQIVGILREAERAGNIEAVCRKHGIAEQTFYRWRKKYGGLDITEARRMKGLELENTKLKRLVADKELMIQGMQEALKKRGWI